MTMMYGLGRVNDMKKIWLILIILIIYAIILCVGICLAIGCHEIIVPMNMSAITKTVIMTTITMLVSVALASVIVRAQEKYYRTGE